MALIDVGGPVYCEVPVLGLGGLEFYEGGETLKGLRYTK